jgi:hydrogenase expression/formation protein HypC
MPGRIIRIVGDAATVDFWGTVKEVRLDTLDDAAQPGDYVISHSGSAVRRIPPDEVLDTLGLYETILAEAGEDPIARDICCELEEEPVTHARA